MSKALPRHFSDPLVWTNLVFVIPFFLTIYAGIYSHAFVILIATMLSVIYHRSHEKQLKKYDMIFAYILIAHNLYTVSFGPFIYFLVALVFVALSFVAYGLAKRRNYPIYHSAWHIFSVLITTTCIVGYIMR